MTSRCDDKTNDLQIIMFEEKYCKRLSRVCIRNCKRVLFPI